MSSAENIIDLYSLIKSAKIKWVINIDDENQVVKKSDEKELIREVASNPEKYKKELLNYKIIEEDNFDIINDLEEISDRVHFLQEILEDQKEKWKAFLLENIESRDNPVIDILKDLKENKVINDYKLLTSVKDAKQKYDEINKEYNPNSENRILWLIDRDFTKVGEGYNSGFEFLNYIVEKNCKGDICFILTANMEDIKYQEHRNEVLKENNILQHNILITFVSKDDFLKFKDDIKCETIEYILQGLWGNYNFLIISQLAKILSESLNSAKKELLKKLTPLTARHIILNFPETEGVSVIDTIYRILTNVMTKKFNEKCQEISPIDRILTDYKELKGKLKFNEIEIDLMFDLMHTEKYDDNVNKLRKNISFGDIFEIEKKYYMLLSQSCDITCRNGKRNINQALLVRMVKSIDEEEQEKEKDKSKIHIKHQSEPLRYFEKGKIYRLEFREFFLIDFDILDLCLFNDKGEAAIPKEALEDFNKLDLNNVPLKNNKIKEIINNIKTKKEEYDTLKKISKYINNLVGKKQIKSGGKDEDLFELKQMNNNYKRLLQNRDFLFSLNLPIDDKSELRYPVKRITRLKEPFSLKIYEEYTNYHSRIGLPGDFAKDFINSKAKDEISNCMDAVSATKEED